MKIVIDKFHGQIPAIKARMLPDGFAQVAKDCKLFAGQIKPLMASDTVNTPTKAGTKRSIHLFGGSTWFHWTQDVNVIRGPIAGDTTERTYYTGDGAPKMTYSPIATTGGTNYPIASYDLGLPVPATAPNLAAVARTGAITGATQANPVVITDAGHGLTTGEKVSIASVGGMTELNGRTFTVTVLTSSTFSLDDEDGTGHTAYTSGGTWTQVYDIADQETRVYVFTYVSALGEEGPPSAPTTIQGVGPDQEVTVSNLGTGPVGSYNVSTKRIYCSTGGDYLYVGEVATATTSFSDTVEAADRGEPCPSVYWTMPPAAMQGICMMPNGIAVGFTGNELCFSEPFIPHAWPESYRLTTDYPIVAIGVTGESVIVATTSTPYIVSGTDPVAMSMAKIELAQACSSKRSLVDMGEYIIYAAPDGLVAIGTSMANVITAEIFDREEWANLDPTSIDGFLWEERYVGFYDNGTTEGGFIFDPKTKSFTLLSDYCEGGHTDAESGDLFVLQTVTGTQYIRKFDGSSTAKSYTWQSKDFLVPAPINLSAGRVDAGAYPMTLKLYADGVLKHTQTVSNASPFRLPGGYRARAFNIELTGSNPPDIVLLGESMREVV